MVRWLMRVVLGGASNKREAPMMAFMVTMAMFAFVVWKQSQGVDMGPVVDVTGWLAAASLAAFTGTTSLHHLRPPAPLAKRGQEPQGGYGAGEWTPEQDAGPAGNPRAGEGYAR